MWNLFTNVRTLAHENAKTKYDKEMEEEGKNRRRIWKEAQRAKIKKKSDGLTVARDYRPPESLLHETVNELPNLDQ